MQRHCISHVAYLVCLARQHPHIIAIHQSAVGHCRPTSAHARLRENEPFAACTSAWMASCRQAGTARKRQNSISTRTPYRTKAPVQTTDREQRTRVACACMTRRRSPARRAIEHGGGAQGKPTQPQAAQRSAASRRQPPPPAAATRYGPGRLGPRARLAAQSDRARDGASVWQADDATGRAGAVKAMRGSHLLRTSCMRNVPM